MVRAHGSGITYLYLKIALNMVDTRRVALHDMLQLPNLFLLQEQFRRHGRHVLTKDILWGT